MSQSSKLLIDKTDFIYTYDSAEVPHSPLATKYGQRLLAEAFAHLEV